MPISTNTYIGVLLKKSYSITRHRTYTYIYAMHFRVTVHSCVLRLSNLKDVRMSLLFMQLGGVLNTLKNLNSIVAATKHSKPLRQKLADW